MNKKGENMADFNITGAVTPKVDIAKWKKMTAQEIIREEGKGEEIPAEIIIWAQQMAAFAKIPDNVTYEQVDGDVGIEALEKLGLDENLVGLEQENAQQATKTEEPDAVKDPNKAENDEGVTEEGMEVVMPESETAEEAENQEIAEFSLADKDLTANTDEIRKRKERKGIL